ncbi:MAG: sodium:solute symporter, partial [Flavobacteriales bacterium]|nr:sodium:solute symporter [Flavobacteriales bacterium]
AVMFAGLFVVFGFILYELRSSVGFGESLQLAGALGKMKIIDTSWDPTVKYTLWSGLIGGFFLQLSYFGTDQSQVQRYLGGKTSREARSGLLMNGLVKIPMQFFILLIGVMVFVFYLFHPAPVHWNGANVEELRTGLTAEGQSSQRTDGTVEDEHAWNAAQIVQYAEAVVVAERAGNEVVLKSRTADLQHALERDKSLRAEYTDQLKAQLPDAEPNDKDYIFISFIMDHMPVGIVGLLLAMIFCAGMGSTSSQLSALATTSVMDVLRFAGTGEQQVVATKWATVAFGILALAFAAVFPLFDNLIEAVNIIGSLFYGTILGIFLAAFFLKHVQGTAVFIAGLISQALILAHFGLDYFNIFAEMNGETVINDPIEIAFLWYNLIAPGIVVALALIFQWFSRSPQQPSHA